MNKGIEKLKALNKNHVVFSLEEYQELKNIGARVIYWEEIKTYE